MTRGRPSNCATSARVAVDIAGYRLENFITQLGLGVDVLQRRENGDDLVATAEVERHVGNRWAVHPVLAIERFSHGTCSSKIVTCLLDFPSLLTNQAGKRSHLRGAFFQKVLQKRARNHFEVGH
jgi:hypothetical protein